MKTAKQRTEHINHCIERIGTNPIVDLMMQLSDNNQYIDGAVPMDWDILFLNSLRSALNARILVEEKGCFYYFFSIEGAERSVAYDIYKKDMCKDDFTITDLQG